MFLTEKKKKIEQLHAVKKEVQIFQPDASGHCFLKPSPYLPETLCPVSAFMGKLSHLGPGQDMC